jgi:hypothetical protein
MHSHANKEHQKPFKDHNRQVTRNGVASWGCDLRALLYSVLEETASDRNP